jgi:hypothetical protein
MADFGYLLDGLELTAEAEDSPLDTALTPIGKTERLSLLSSSFSLQTIN